MALVPGGWLLVSAAEASAELFQPLVPINFPGAILYRKGEDPAVSRQPSAASEWKIGVRGQVSGDRGENWGTDLPP
jgi:hypothetical protein